MLVNLRLHGHLQTYADSHTTRWILSGISGVKLSQCNTIHLRLGKQPKKSEKKPHDDPYLLSPSAQAPGTTAKYTDGMLIGITNIYFFSYFSDPNPLMSSSADLSNCSSQYPRVVKC